MPSFVSLRRSLAVGTLALAALCVSAHVVRAQTPTPLTQEPAGYISIDPFVILLGGFNAEVEGALNPDISLGAAATYLPSSASGFDKGEHYGTFDLKLRFYPQGRAPAGFSVALLGGTVSYIDGSDKTKGGTFGFEADYNWLTGPRKKFLVGTGFGIRRVFGSNNSDDILPALRFQIGYVFSQWR